MAADDTSIAQLAIAIAVAEARGKTIAKEKVPPRVLAKARIVARRGHRNWRSGVSRD